MGRKTGRKIDPWGLLDGQNSTIFFHSNLLLRRILLPWQGPSSRWLLSPIGLALPILVTLIPQGLMGASNAGFGPDTSIGILPMPHVLLYCALFFGFGVLYYDCGDPDNRLGRGWR